MKYVRKTNKLHRYIRWSNGMKERLSIYWKAGMPIDEIADLLAVSIGSAMNKAFYLKLGKCQERKRNMKIWAATFVK